MTSSFFWFFIKLENYTNFKNVLKGKATKALRDYYYKKYRKNRNFSFILKALMQID